MSKIPTIRWKDGFESSITLPIPFGAHVMGNGVQFTIFSRHATKVWLLIFNEPHDDKPCMEIELDPQQHHIGDLWHIQVEDAHAGQFYVYRMDGPHDRSRGECYNPDQWLLDPYAYAVAGAPEWGSTYGLEPGQNPINGWAVPKGVIVQDDFDWAEDRSPDIPIEDAIIYETHIRGYTAHSSASVQHPGTYRGFIEKIPYIKDLGVTSVEFLPLQEFNEMEYYTENMGRRDMRNFWGYSTQAFFAPMSRFAADGVGGQQIREFRELVTALHREGLEVILDIVFNHTCEGSMEAATYSFRGIDNSIYYMMEDNGKHYRNYSGCGNTVNCNHPVARQFILDCLRYWVLYMHVDGFRFDLASVLTRGQHGEVLSNPPLVEAIAEDPILRHTKLIAEAWDAAGLYQVGSFPNPHWSEWNGKYRDHIRRFWSGEKGMLRAFVTHLVGSPDLYSHEKQTPQKSINFITAHDGFTMYDMVSYLEKRNLANQENNNDGERFNESQNCGVEGETDDPKVLAKRKRQQKNLFATLLLSQGVPMILAGDEFSRTQKGNNNAYCQDNEISWIDWSLQEKHRDLIDFVKETIAFRKSQAALRRNYFLNDQTHGDSQSDVLWSGPTKKDINWDQGRSIACFLSGNIDHNTPQIDDDIFIIFNASEQPRAFTPVQHENRHWTLALSTQDSPPSWRRNQKTIKVDGLSVNVLIRKP